MFVGLDGEGVTDLERRKRQFLTLFGSSIPGEAIENYGDGLTTRECLEFLIRQRELEPTATFVSFGFGWDVNMILREEINSYAFRSLKANGFCHLTYSDGWTFRIEYLPRKWFKVSKYVRFPNGEIFRPDHWAITVYDVWSFFQSSFVQALISWGIASKIDLKEMESMKKRRGSFTEEARDEIRDYNFSECVMLCAIMDKLRSKLESVGIKLSRWHGPGAVADAVYKKHGSAPYLPKSEHIALRHAFFGGRIQTVKLGHYLDVWSYDIRSAYPFIQANLPGFENVEPCEVNDGISPYDLVDVSWDVRGPVTPFPYRLPDGSIQFYRSGRGIYHAREYHAAAKHFPLNVNKVWRIPFDDTLRPFEFIEGYYEARALFRAAGDECHMALRLVLNSLYGKTAQKNSNYNRKTKTFTAPRWRSYMIAGAITSGTRAMLLDAAMSAPNDTVMFATDSISSLTRMPLKVGTALGEWDESFSDQLRVYQPGLYVHLTADNLGKMKTRSIRLPAEERDRAEMWARLFAYWEAYGCTAEIEFTAEQFVTYGLESKTREWCTWERTPKLVSLKPSKGHPDPPDEDGNVQLRPLPGPTGGFSYPYLPGEHIDPCAEPGIL